MGRPRGFAGPDARSKTGNSKASRKSARSEIFERSKIQILKRSTGSIVSVRSAGQASGLNFRQRFRFHRRFGKHVKLRFRLQSPIGRR